jgi:transglutaminase-like putative cysteine protease
VLLAGLARARGIPARVAMGLVYTTQGFGFHLWTEVWINDRWIPLDGTLGRGGIGAAHLKLGNSNLKGVSAFTGFIPVAQVLGRLKIKILEVDSER